MPDKSIIYNQILKGVKEFPALIDLKVPAIRLIIDGCVYANDYNQATEIMYGQ